MRQTFRLLVTGDRTWDDTSAVEHTLAAILAHRPEGVLLVHGACPHGADAIASAYAARTPGYRTEAHPANWHRHGRTARHLRNAEMVGLGADGCVVPARRQPWHHGHRPAGPGGRILAAQRHVGAPIITHHWAA